MIYNKKLQVFVSSTFTDLKEERQAAVEAILTAGHIPAGMELFAAGDQSQLNVIKRWIDESDVYLLIIGGRYGSLDPNTGKSYTQLEYEYAVATNKPVFAVVAHDNYTEEKVKRFGSDMIEKENTKLLRGFKEEVLKKMVKFFGDTKDIKLAILETMAEFSRRDELKGWMPGSQGRDTGILAEEIARLTKENSELRSRVIEANTNEPTYNSLTFSQIEILLKNIEVENLSGVKNLWEFFIANADAISDYITVREGSNEDIALHKLRTFGIVEYAPDVHWDPLPPDMNDYKFSQDGHRLYLMVLVKLAATL